jgi:hypothetical protein
MFKLMDLGLYVDESERQFTFINTQDVEPILERNKQLRDQDQSSDWGRHIGSIPNVILLQWFNEEYAKGNTSLRMYTEEFDRIIHRKLQDPEFFYLRTDRPALQAGWSAGLL